MIRIRPYDFLRPTFTATVAATAAWLLYTVICMPSQDSEQMMPATYPPLAALLLAAGAGLAVAWRRMRIVAADRFAAFTIVWVACNAAHFGSSDPWYDHFAQAAMLYIALRIIFAVRHSTKSAVAAVLFCLAVYQCAVGIGQAFGFSYSYHSLFRITGTLFNPGPYAGLIAPMAACAAAYATTRYAAMRRRWTRLRLSPERAWPRTAVNTLVYAAACVAVAAAVVVLPATMSRAAWIAFACPAALLALRESGLPRRLKRYYAAHRLRAALYVAAAMLLAAAVMAGIYIIKRPSADGRMLIWRIDTRIIMHNPLWGVGAGNFAGAFGHKQAEYFASQERPESEKRVAGCPEAGFNEYLQFGAQTGVAGMAALAATAICAIAAGMRRRDPYAYGLMAAAAFALFSYPFAVVPLRFVFVILLAASASQSPRSQGPSSLPGGIGAIALVLCVIFCPPLYARSRQRAEAHKAWQDARVWLSSERYDYIVEDGQRLYDRLGYDFRFLYDYGYALHKTGEYTRSNEVLMQGIRRSSDPMFYNIAGKNYEALGDIARAAECYATAHAMIPSRIYPLYLAAMMYRNADMRHEAVKTARRALGMKVKVESEQTRELRRELRELIKEYE